MKFIDCRYITLDKFAAERGFQPTNAVFYVKGGSFSLCIGDQTEIITENDVVFFPEDMEFERHIISPITFYYVRFEGGQDIPRGRVNVSNHIRLVTSFEYLLTLTQRPDGGAEFKNYYLNDIFMQIKTDSAIEKNLRDDVVVSAIRYFELNICNKITLSDVAAAVGVSVSGLIQHFNDHTNLTPAKYLTAMRIKKAEMLLCSGDMPLSEIASQCGYDNSFYFSNTFKKVKGVSPKVYRQKYGI